MKGNAVTVCNAYRNGNGLYLDIFDQNALQKQAIQTTSKQIEVIQASFKHVDKYQSVRSPENKASRCACSPCPRVDLRSVRYQNAVCLAYVQSGLPTLTLWSLQERNL